MIGCGRYADVRWRAGLANAGGGLRVAAGCASRTSRTEARDRLYGDHEITVGASGVGTTARSRRRCARRYPEGRLTSGGPRSADDAAAPLLFTVLEAVGDGLKPTPLACSRLCAYRACGFGWCHA